MVDPAEWGTGAAGISSGNAILFGNGGAGDQGGTGSTGANGVNATISNQAGAGTDGIDVTSHGDAVVTNAGDG